MAINKVEANGETLIDLTEDTVTPETLVKGVTAHDASGEPIEGALDLDIYQTKTDESLDTADKTVPGAINELKNRIDGLVKVTDLTGKTYKVKVGWAASAGYGSFSVTGNLTYRIAGNTVNRVINAIRLGYTAITPLVVDPPPVLSYAELENYLVFNYGTSSYGNLDPQLEFTLEITGGSDVTNTDLIEWLDTYGELIAGADKIDLSAYQPKEDENLNTESKEIVGAINEVNSKVGTPIVTTTGTGAAYVATVEGITELKAGISFIMLPHTYNTTLTPTLNVNGLGAKYLKRYATDRTALDYISKTSFFQKNHPYRIMYDGTAWLLEDYTKPSAADLHGSVPVGKGGVPSTNVDNKDKVLTTNESGTPEWRTPSTVDKVKSIDTWNDGVSDLGTDDGIYWTEGFQFNTDPELNGDTMASGKIYHRIPIVAGENINFKADGGVVKINATGGSYISKYVVEISGSENVVDIINKLTTTYPDYQLGVWGLVEFTGATSGLYGLTINHYGGNIYNISGVNFGTFYSMANNVTDWSQVSVWAFSGYFQPPIPYCDDSNNGQVLKVVNGVPTWVNP